MVFIFSLRRRVQSRGITKCEVWSLAPTHTHPSPSCSRLTSVARVTFDACRYPGSQSTKMNYTLFHLDERKTNLEREIQKNRHKQRTDSVELCDYGHRYIPWPTHPLLLTANNDMQQTRCRSDSTKQKAVNMFRRRTQKKQIGRTQRDRGWMREAGEGETFVSDSEGRG